MWRRRTGSGGFGSGGGEGWFFSYRKLTNGTARDTIEIDGERGQTPQPDADQPADWRIEDLEVVAHEYSIRQFVAPIDKLEGAE
jgi:hypothetical protein